MLHLNCDNKLLGKGGRVAVKIEKEDLLRLLSVLPNYEGSQDVAQSIRDNLVFPVITNLLRLVREDFLKYDVELKNFEYLGVFDSLNDVPFVWCSFHDEDHLPVYGMIFWDGLNFRGYIPRYGNLLDLRYQAALSTNWEEWNMEDLTYWDGLYRKTIFFKNDMGKGMFLRELIKTVEVQRNACFMDYMTRVTPRYESTPTSINTAIKKLHERGLATMGKNLKQK